MSFFNCNWRLWLCMQVDHSMFSTYVTMFVDKKEMHVEIVLKRCVGIWREKDSPFQKCYIIWCVSNALTPLLQAIKNHKIWVNIWILYATCAEVPNVVEKSLIYFYMDSNLIINSWNTLKPENKHHFILYWRKQQDLQSK